MNVARIKRTGMGFGGAARQVPYAMARAINWTDNDMQTAVRAGVHQRFIVRRATFIDRLVKIKAEDRATKAKLQAKLRIEGPEGFEDRGDILARHEVDAVHTRDGGSIYATERMFYIPTEVLRFPPEASVPRSMYPRALRLGTRHDVTGTLGPNARLTRHNTIQLQGKRRTFVLNRSNSDIPLGIFQRKEGKPGKSRPHDIALIWHFTSRVHIHARLNFKTTSAATYTERIAPNTQRAFADAFKSAR